MERTLPIVECFHSLQGEGRHVGKSAFFIRLASCKVGCPWCDTKISWSSTIHPQKDLIGLAKNTANAQREGASFVVLTGGEPLHHNLNPLCQQIRQITLNENKASIPIHLETSGVDPLSGRPDWITVSPKRHAPPRTDVLEVCDELKVVIHSEEDLRFAEQMAERTDPQRTQNLLFLQPGWDHAKGQQLAYEFVKKNPKWRLSLQIHKWLGIL